MKESATKFKYAVSLHPSTTVKLPNFSEFLSQLSELETCLVEYLSSKDPMLAVITPMSPKLFSDRMLKLLGDFSHPTEIHLQKCSHISPEAIGSAGKEYFM